MSAIRCSVHVLYAGIMPDLVEIFIISHDFVVYHLTLFLSIILSTQRCAFSLTVQFIF